ncbi:MAG: aminopeptidase P family protein [archaeon]|nr:MAG: aminopeptidase P family protein [archaeon]
MMFSRRIKKLRKGLGEKKIDAALFLSSEPIDDPNIYYFTGFRQMKYHSFACLLITKNKTTLVLSSLDYDRATGREADEVLKKDGPLSKTLKERIKKNRRIGVIESLFPHKLSKNFKVKDISGLTDKIRSIKQPEEIENIRQACSIANKGIVFLKKNIREGLTERELALELERFLIKKGADGISFPTTLVSPSRSWQIHPFPPFSKNKIKRGLGYADFGASYSGYCSDVTVPFGIGRLTEKEKKIVKTVEQAYRNSLKKLKPGAEAQEIYRAAENSIRESGFEFKHNLGHGLGLETHDPPAISPESKTKITRNMVFTIEPGIYVKGPGGCRLENDFIMKSRGFEVLTKSRFLKI